MKEFGLRYKVQAGQASEGKSTSADILMCSNEFVSVVEGTSAKLIPITSFTDKDELRDKLEPALKELGFIE